MPINNPMNKPVVIHSSSGLSCLQFESLEKTGLSHSVFTRKGGVSASPYESLNISYNTGDLPSSIGKNLELIKGQMGASQIVSMNQVHGIDVAVFHKGDHNDYAVRNADAIITDVPMLGIMVKQADCQGVILHDPVRDVAAVVHCGWRGNVQNILGVALLRMMSEFGCETRDIVAAIGPSLGPCCSEFTTYREIFPRDFITHMVSENHFNLWEVSRMQLLRAGLNKEKIETAGICTKCNTDLFYSYRGEGETGRFGTVAMLKE
jgi:polyphenol oxidase